MKLTTNVTLSATTDVNGEIMGKLNSTDYLVLKKVEELMNSDIKKGKGRKSDFIAFQLGCGARKVQYTTSVTKNASYKQKYDIMNGKKSIHGVYKELHPKKTKKAQIDNSNFKNCTTCCCRCTRCCCYKCCEIQLNRLMHGNKGNEPDNGKPSN
jgi:hypothetical protein